MAFNFPASPTIGQVFEDYVWDGQKWIKVAPGDAVVSPTPPSNPVSGDLWWDTSSNTFYVWVTPPGAWTPTSSAGALTEAPVNGGVYGRRNAAWAYAAPMDALAYSGMQVNGSMEVNQENGSGAYVVDGWKRSVNLLGGGTVSFSQISLPTEIPGFAYALQFISNIPQATLSGSDFVRFQHPIEGYRFLRAKWGTSAAIPVTVGFWVRAALTGTYRALIFNSSGAASTPWMPFTIDAPGTFQYITLTFPAVTTGTWNRDNQTGANLVFEMASSSTPNLMAATSNYATITGVVVLPGTQAPTAAQSPLIMRPFDQELVTCQRYWQRTSIWNRFMATAGSQSHDVTGKFNQSFRASATLALPTPGSRGNAGSIGIDSVTLDGSFRHTMLSVGAGDSFALGDIVTGDARL